MRSRRGVGKGHAYWVVVGPFTVRVDDVLRVTVGPVTYEVCRWKRLMSTCLEGVETGGTYLSGGKRRHGVDVRDARRSAVQEGLASQAQMNEYLAMSIDSFEKRVEKCSVVLASCRGVLVSRSGGQSPSR
jgi:hypothetical protein